MKSEGSLGISTNQSHWRPPHRETQGPQDQLSRCWTHCVPGCREKEWCLRDRTHTHTKNAYMQGIPGTVTAGEKQVHVLHGQRHTRTDTRTRTNVATLRQLRTLRFHARSVLLFEQRLLLQEPDCVSRVDDVLDLPKERETERKGKQSRMDDKKKEWSVVEEGEREGVHN